MSLKGTKLVKHFQRPVMRRTISTCINLVGSESWKINLSPTLSFFCLTNWYHSLVRCFSTCLSSLLVVMILHLITSRGRFLFPPSPPGLFPPPKFLFSPWIRTSGCVSWNFAEFELGKLRKTRSEVLVQGQNWNFRGAGRENPKGVGEKNSI
jgi:hypothetical protein